MPGAVRIDALHQSRPVIVDIHFLAAIGVVHADAAVIAPCIARVHLRKTGPVPDTARGFTRPFPRPKETRPTGQLPLKNDVLFVVPINLALTDGIGRRHQSSGVVIGVGNDVLLGHPHEGFVALGAMDLVVHRHNPTQLVAQEQRTPRTVIQSLNTPQPIPENAQSVVIRIADRRQHAVAEVIKPRRLGQHQLARNRAQINRRFRQAVGNCRTSSRRQGQGGGAILMVGPHHRIARNRKPLSQRMTPAKPQPAIHLHRAGAVQARPLERQDAIERTVGEGQQFLASDHRHRATVRNGFMRRSRCIALRIRRHGRHIIHRLLAHQRRTLRLAAHHRHRVRNQMLASLQRRHRHRLDRRRRTAQQQRLCRLHMRPQPRPRHLPGQQLQ
ncbi:hypothetical protein [Pseudomonas sp. 37 R 15]|nr:hypothetical protein [Pseudomonas sp. 37 R 15]